MGSDPQVNVLAVLPRYVVNEERADEKSARTGAWITTHEFLAAAARAGHRVAVISTLQHGNSYVIDDVHVLPLNGSTVDDAWSAASPHAHVVVTHIGSADDCTQRARDAGIPTVRFAHGLTKEWADVHGDVVIFNSESLQAEAADLGHVPARSEVLQPPIRLDDVRVDPGEHVTIGALSQLKGAPTFWAAARFLKDQQFLGVLATYRFSIGPDGRVIRKVPHDNRVLANARIIPPALDVRDVLSQTKILMVPSKKESYGRLAVEAALSGIPVIASPTPGLQEALGDCAEFIDPDEHFQWAQYIARLCAHPDAWEEASARARQVEARLRPNDCDRFVQILEDVCLTS